MVDVIQKHTRVLIADSVSEHGVELLRGTPGFEVDVRTGLSPDELRHTIGDYDALIVRSATRVTAHVLQEPGRLKAIGRAGTGVDNIDLEAATRAGIVVMNTPGGNSLAAAELTLALLLSMARDVPQANAEMRDGRWERKAHVGVELAGKTLGVVGLGRIGREVAVRAQAFRMDVIGYDPFVSQAMAEAQGIRYRPLNDVIAESDILTLHIPLTPETHHMLNERTLAAMRPGSRIINCARGGLIDEAALLAALEAGRIGGAALDVFEEEPPADQRLVRHPRVVSTPHLGASTREAQERVGVEIAEKIRDFVQSGVILDAVNFPSIARKEYAELGPLMDLASRLASFLAQIADGGFKRLQVTTQGTFNERALKPVAMAAAKGLLTPLVEGSVSYVNALGLAGERGITVDEARSGGRSPYSGLLRLTLDTDQGSTTVAGTLYAADRPRIVEVDGVPIESHPAGHMLMIRNRDVPGVVGQIGSLFGRAGVNIAGIQLGRVGATDRAVSIINVDCAVPPETLEQIAAMDEILRVWAIAV